MSETYKNDKRGHGLLRDLDQILDRRKTLSLIGGVGAVSVLGGCDFVGPLFGGPPPGRNSEVVGTGAGGEQCVGLPPETAGPFPADGSNRAHGTLANVLADSGVVRTDMRGNIGGDASSATPGVKFDLTIRLVDVGSNCSPLSSYAIYLWHCDAQGRYSLYDVKGTTHLRAVQVSDDRGEVTFTTIVPGCYAGRCPHFHFEVYRNLGEAASYKNRLLTSQLAVPDAVCREVYEADQAYQVSLQNLEHTPSLKNDMIFADNSAAQIAAQTIQMSGSPVKGYSGGVTVGL